MCMYGFARCIIWVNTRTAVQKEFTIRCLLHYFYVVKHFEYWPYLMRCLGAPLSDYFFMGAPCGKAWVFMSWAFRRDYWKVEIIWQLATYLTLSRQTVWNPIFLFARRAPFFQCCSSILTRRRSMRMGGGQQIPKSLCRSLYLPWCAGSRLWNSLITGSFPTAIHVGGHSAWLRERPCTNPLRKM